MSVARAGRKNILRKLFREIAAGGARATIRIPNVTTTSREAREYLVQRALSKPPAAVRHLTTVRDGIMYRNFVWGATRFTDDVWFGDGTRGEADTL